MTTKEVCERYGMKTAMVTRWAKDNGVKRGEPINGIMAYDWTEEDCKRFEQRKGRKK